MEVTDALPITEISRNGFLETAKEVMVGIAGGVTQVLIGMF